MKREYIVIVLVLMVVVAIAGGVYKFYFKPRLEIYAEDRDRAQRLESQLKQLEQTFMKFEPSVIVKHWKGEVIPWQEAVFARAPYFNTADFFQTEPVPDVMMLKFYYQEESQRMLNELRRKVQGNPYCRCQGLGRFGAPVAANYQKMDSATVRKGLKIIEFGSSMVEMLMDAKAADISRVEIWPERIEYGGLLRMHTTGLAFKMTLKNLVIFIEEGLRVPRGKRYFDINAVGVQNRRLRAPNDPLLDVRMLLTQASFVMRSAQEAQPADRPGMRQAAPGGRMSDEMVRMRRARGEMASERRVRSGPRQLTKWGRFMKWLKFNFWPF